MILIVGIGGGESRRCSKSKATERQLFLLRFFDDTFSRSLWSEIYQCRII